LFATLFILGDKKVVHDVSRLEAGRNQAGARRGAAFAMPQRDLAMELVVSENFVPIVRSSRPPSWVLNFWNSKVILTIIIHHRHAIPPTSRLVRGRRGKRIIKKKTRHKKLYCPVHKEDPLPARRADSEQKSFVDLVMME
jgi:hypothetical protein